MLKKEGGISKNIDFCCIYKMNDAILIMMSISAFLVIYWVIIGQWKYNKMMKHPDHMRAVLFDLDGVLVDSLEAWFNVFNKTRENYKFPKVTKEKFIEEIWGCSFETAARDYLGDMNVEELKKYYFSHFDEFMNDTKIMPGVKGMLDEIRKKELKMAVVTNTNRNIVMKMLEVNGLTKYFDVIVAGDDVEEGKPEPYSILQACKQLIIKPSEGLFVGDTDNDKLAAKAASMTFVGFKIKGDYKINEPDELLMLL